MCASAIGGLFCDQFYETKPNIRTGRIANYERISKQSLQGLTKPGFPYLKKGMDLSDSLLQTGSTGPVAVQVGEMLTEATHLLLTYGRRPFRAIQPDVSFGVGCSRYVLSIPTTHTHSQTHTHTHQRSAMSLLSFRFF